VDDLILFVEAWQEECSMPIRLPAKSENLGISPIPTKGDMHETHTQKPVLARNRIGTECSSKLLEDLGVLAGSL
jgi:hypothetical protein